VHKIIKDGIAMQTEMICHIKSFIQMIALALAVDTPLVFNQKTV
jgi:hypothetical protein